MSQTYSIVNVFFPFRPQEIITLPERLLIVSNVPKTLVANKEVETVIKRYGKFKKVLPLNGRVRNSNLNLFLLA